MPCVQRYDERTREATVISVWGASQSFRNISMTPAPEVEIGLQRFRTQTALPDRASRSSSSEKRCRTRRRSVHRVGAGRVFRAGRGRLPIPNSHHLAHRLPRVTFSPPATQDAASISQ